MSDQVVPRPNPKSKQVSQQEYDLREERAPETVNEYQVIPNEHTPTTQLPSRPQQEQRTWQPRGPGNQQTESQHLLHHQVATVSHANATTDVQGCGSNRRSLLFEEWKARSLRSPGQMKEAGFSSSAIRKGNNLEARRSTTSGDVRMSPGERFQKAGSVRVKCRPINDGRGQKPESIDVRNEATSGDGIRSSVGHTTIAAHIYANPEPANRNRTQHPKAEKTRDTATSKDDKARLGEHPDKVADSQATTSLGNEGYVPQTEAAKTVNSTTSNDTRGHRGKNSKRATTVRAKVSTTNGGYDQQREGVKPDNANEGSLTSVCLEGYTPAPSFENTNTPLVTPGSSTRKKGGKGRKFKGRPRVLERQSSRGHQASHERQSSLGRLTAQELRSSKELQPSRTLESAHTQQTSEEQRGSHGRHPRRSRQGSIERQQHYRERAREQAVYTAPNSTQFGVDELRRMAHGVRVSGNVKVYFIPCFIEDPWRDVKPVPCIRPPDLMSRF
ncbi:hypothetical protein BDW66DRAFT_165728 [Aspergillus desertorum]